MFTSAPCRTLVTPHELCGQRDIPGGQRSEKKITDGRSLTFTPYRTCLYADYASRTHALPGLQFWLVSPLRWFREVNLRRGSRTPPSSVAIYRVHGRKSLVWVLLWAAVVSLTSLWRIDNTTLVQSSLFLRIYYRSLWQGLAILSCPALYNSSRFWRLYQCIRQDCHRAQELCESRGGRPGLPSLINPRFLWTQSNTSATRLS